MSVSATPTYFEVIRTWESPAQQTTYFESMGKWATEEAARKAIGLALFFPAMEDGEENVNITIVPRYED